MKNLFYIKIQRIISILLLLAFLTNMLAFAQDDTDVSSVEENSSEAVLPSESVNVIEEIQIDEPETIVLTTNSLLASDNIKLIRELVVDKDGNVQRTYVIEFTPEGNGVMRFLNGENLNTRNYIDMLIEIDNRRFNASSALPAEEINKTNSVEASDSANNTSALNTLTASEKNDEAEDISAEIAEEIAETAKAHTLNPVAAMNCDFFNISTGVPESAVITDGEIITSDRDNYVFAVTNEGKFFFDKPLFTFEVKFNDKNYNILHYNKEFTEYGLYLYSSHYGHKTRITVPSTELVLFPYTVCKTYEELAVDYFKTFDLELPLDFYIQQEPSHEELVSDTVSEVITVEEVAAVINETEETSEIEPDDETVTADKPKLSVNPVYKDSIDNYITENNFVLIGDKYYSAGDSSLYYGGLYSFVVEEIRNNAEGKSLELPLNRLVLAAKTETQGFKLEKAYVGMDLTLSVGGNDAFSDVKNAIGCGEVIVKDGNVVTHNSLSHYNSYQPRTALGITQDGRIIMYSVDGRGKTLGKGLKLKALSEEMIRHGCVYAVNLDGGGSTTVKMTDYADGEFKTVNIPSDGAERKVANALGFFNTLEKTGLPAYSYFLGNNVFVMPGSSLPVELNPVYFDTAFYSVVPDIDNSQTEDSVINSDTNENDVVKEITVIEAVNPFEELFTYYVEAEKGIFVDGVYSPLGYIGKTDIISESINGDKNVAFTVTSTDKVDEIVFENDVSHIYVGDEVDFNVNSKYYGFEVFGSDSEYEWNISLPCGIIDENGLFSSLSASENVVITASFGETKAEYPLEIRELPFLDIENHWSKSSVCKVYENGITIGELTDLGRMYFPDRNFSRNEFCVMLARLMGLTQAVDTLDVKQTVNDQTEETPEEISEDTAEVRAETVENKEFVIDGEEKIEESVTEEIVNTSSATDESYTETEKMDIPVIVEEKHPLIKETFYDSDSIPSWSADSVEKLLEIEYLDGFYHVDDDGNTLFDGSLQVTRREFIRLLGKLLDEVPDDYSVELTDISGDDEDLDSIRKVLFYGLFIGYEDKTLRPEGFLTRAEVAQVFNRLEGII